MPFEVSVKRSRLIFFAFLKHSAFIFFWIRLFLLILFQRKRRALSNDKSRVDWIVEGS